MRIISEHEALVLCHDHEPVAWNELCVTLPNNELAMLHRIPRGSCGIMGAFDVPRCCNDFRWALTEA
jgi:hypothetical protein